jgi:ParB-like chromosome segregation protein Spo0J
MSVPTKDKRRRRSGMPTDEQKAAAREGGKLIQQAALSERRPRGEPTQATQLQIADIIVGHRLRALNEEAVKDLMKSIDATGGLESSPIVVRRTDRGLELVVGLHRLEAHRRRGKKTILAFVRIMNDDEALKLQIAENLYRAELTALERDEHIAEWIRLTETEVSSQVATKPQGGRPESGVRAAARELGIDKDDAHRAVRVASIAPEAKEAAREAGLDDTRSALLTVAKESPDQQVAKVTEIAKSKRAKGKRRPREEIEREKAEKLQRKIDKEKSDAARKDYEDRRESAIGDAAALIAEHFPDPASYQSLVKNLEEGGLIYSTLVDRLRRLRPGLFEWDDDDGDDDDDVGDAIVANRATTQPAARRP